MPDMPVIYLATTEGEEGFKLFKATDPRLVRRHIIDSMPVPKVEVRRPTTEEAMEAALDGVAIIDITKKDAPTEPDLLTKTEGNEPNGADATATIGGSAPHSDQNTSSEDEGNDLAPVGTAATTTVATSSDASGGEEVGLTDATYDLPVGADDPRLAPGEYVDNDGEVHSDDAVLERQEPVVDEDPFGRVDA